MAEEQPKKKGIIKEFKEFISRGNVVDLAVGVIIGGAFTAIVTALTGQILQPVINWLIGLIGGDGSLETARTKLHTVYDAEGAIDWSKTNYIDWGAFISAIINFILIAIILFAFVKLINKFREKEEMVKAKVAKKDKEEK